ncbi:hypothetical protein [Streptosporangium sp. NPDC049644]|uniref:hypothetical protein n=1 Tax=Streptosporangium sp. NPDC049644 TaxID=3155507 RepID=UPI00341D9A35
MVSQTRYSRVCQFARARRILGSRLTVQPSEGGDEVDITVACRGLDDVHQLLQFADGLTVIDPLEARDRIREIVARILHQYS